MAYCAEADLVARFGATELLQLTDPDITGAVNLTVLAQAIADADALINSYLNNYLPLATKPTNLVRLACIITRYYLYGMLVPDRVKADYDDAVRFLTKVAEGKISLAPDSNGVIEVQQLNMVSFPCGDNRVFGRDD